MNLLQRNFVLSCGVAASALLLVPQAGAASFTIFNGQTVNATQALNTPGDVGTVEQGGTIDAGAGAGISSSADGVTVNNAGSVTGTSDGIDVDNDSVVTNSGTVIGTGSAGIWAINSNNIINSGTATGGLYGIGADSSNTIANTGTANGGVYGIAIAENNTLTNSGTVIGTSSSGITGQRYNVITNSGTVTGGIHGIFGIDSNTIINSGLASGQYGIFADNNNTITNAGTASGSNNIGIRAAYNNMITNSGTASGSVYGIAVISNNTITNSGTATGGVYGIAADNDNTITNSGTVTGGDLVGIFGEDNNTITNSGIATGKFLGIRASNYNTIINSGTAMAIGGGVNDIGIAVLSNNAITNSGTATGGGTGIYLDGANTLTNSGTVTGGNFGIHAGLSNNTITNSGTIIGTNSAVIFDASNNTLRLLAGSNIQGNLALGNASNELIIGPGLNTALAFTGGTIVDTGLPFIIDAGVLYAVDVTGFSVQDELTNDLTRAVTGAVDGRLAAARTAGAGLSTAMNGAVVHATADLPAGADGGFWASGLGFFRYQQGSSETVDFNSLLGGFVVGGDGMVSGNTRAGLFAGLAFAGLETEDNAQDLASDSFFGGAYLGHDMGQSFINASLIAGWSSFDSDRHIANNQVPGGIETASADYDGVLLSPSLTLGHSMIMEAGWLTPSLRVRYAGLFLDGYTETGSSANLTVGDRDFHVLDARAELAFDLAPHETETGVFSSTLRIGLDGTLTSGGDVSATLLGQSLNFTTADSNTLRGFAGFDATYAMGSSTSFTLRTEVGYDSSKALTGQATAGLVWNF